MNYGQYLNLNSILNSQFPESEKKGLLAHDEMLFIITHQAYELWFKQILFELDSVVGIFQDPVLDDEKMGVAHSRLERVITIQRVLVHQIDIIETMTPMDFLEFRDFLIPASGFQSIQFKKIEIVLGIKKKSRTPADQDFFRTRLQESERQILEDLESRQSLLELLENWLERIPFLEFGEFDFWKAYQTAANKMFERDESIIRSNSDLSAEEIAFQVTALQNTRKQFQSLLNKSDANHFNQDPHFCMNQRAVLAALFIKLYRDQPILHLPYKLLTNLIEIDELWTTWRQRHAIMVQRMLGTRIGTGGSAGADYLKKTTEKNRVFSDLFHLSSYMIPRSELPELPESISRQLGFYFTPKN